MSPAARTVRLVALLAAAVHVAALGYVFARRVGFGYDLEWMEGGTLCHSLRLLEGQPLYAPPSVDFIPYLYTPLYPALVALASKLFGLRYVVGRLLSVGAYAGASVLGYRFAARVGGSRAAAAAAMAIPAAGFALTGAWYDLVRADSLWLFLSTAALVILYRAARPGPASAKGADATDAAHRAAHEAPHEGPHEGEDSGWSRPASAGARAQLLAAAAGALLVAAFFAKQTAGPLMAVAALALLLLDLRLLPAFVGAMAICGLPTLWWLNRSSGGWFWRYVFELHQGHDFYARRAFVETPATLLAIVGPAMLVPLWALVRRPSVGLAYAVWLGFAGMVTACTAFGTQWAFANAYIPGVFFPSLAIGVGAGRLLGTRRNPGPRLRPVLVYALLAISLIGRRVDGHWRWNWDPPARFIPTVADRVAGDRLIAQLRAAGGDVLIPFHPFYGYLAGKRTFVHQMGVMDVGRAGLGVPSGLAEAIREQRFALVIVDDKIADKWTWWPELRARYRDAGPVAGPHVVSGALTVPSLALVPRGSPTTAPRATGPAIDLDLQ